MNFEKILKKRASIKQYSDKNVKIDAVIDCIEAANLAPSPGNLQLLNYIIIEDKEKINELANASQQEFIKSAKVLVVICSLPKAAKEMYFERAESYLKHHVGAAVENFLLKIARLKLAACWVGAFSDVTVKNLLKIPEDAQVEVIIPIGHQHKLSREEQKKKPSLENVIYFEKWANKEKEKETQISRSSI
jgi:nitroreductase